MPKSKFKAIYRDLKEQIEHGIYPFQALIPSENTLSEVYNCTRNTVRRAYAELISIGYIQSQQGRRVRVIYQPIAKNKFMIGNIETFKETAIRNNFTARTEVIHFSETVADEKIAENSGFAVGTELYNVHRVRYINDKALILDINLFLKEVIPGLTPEIVSNSVYEYLENDIGMVIVTSKRRATVELATNYDYKYLELGDYNCLAVISGRTYNADGVQFEYTQSRHRPDYFCFEDTATRRKHLLK